MNEKLEKVLEQFTGEKNNKETRDYIVDVLTDELISATKNSVKIVCDETNNPQSVIDAHQICVDLVEASGHTEITTYFTIGKQ